MTRKATIAAFRWTHVNPRHHPEIGIGTLFVERMRVLVIGVTWIKSDSDSLCFDYKWMRNIPGKHRWSKSETVLWSSSGLKIKVSRTGFRKVGTYVPQIVYRGIGTWLYTIDGYDKLVRKWTVLLLYCDCHIIVCIYIYIYIFHYFTPFSYQVRQRQQASTCYSFFDEW